MPQPGGLPDTQTPPATVNGMAIAAMVLSLLGIFLYGIVSVPGVILGHFSLTKIKQTGQRGRGMALTAVIAGYIVIGGWCVALLVFMLFVAFALSGSF